MNDRHLSVDENPQPLSLTAAIRIHLAGPSPVALYPLYPYFACFSQFPQFLMCRYTTHSHGGRQLGATSVPLLLQDAHDSLTDFTHFVKYIYKVTFLFFLCQAFSVTYCIAKGKVKYISSIIV